MPKKLIESTETFNNAIAKYRTTTGRNPYQPLETFIEKLKQLSNENKH